MKTAVRILTLVLLVSFLVACAAPTAAPGVTPPETTDAPVVTDAPVATEEALTAQEAWLKANQLGPYDTGEQDWAAIEAAAIAEGTVLVYANTSKIEKSAEAFMEKYPGITVQAFDLGGDDVLMKTVEEQKAGAFVGDVWASSGGADLVGNVLPNNYVWRFIPTTVADRISEEFTQPLLMSRLGTSVFAYNHELEASCPVANVWEFTNPEWKGRFYIEDPLNDASTLSKLLTFVSHPDEMHAAYVELYGEEPVLDADTPDAGWLWLKRFAQNGPIPQPGGDEVDEAFATPGMTKSAMALTSYSNYADVLEGALVFEPCFGIAPVL